MMISEKQLFQSYLSDINKEFAGWDFSFITGTGRMRSNAMSWSYGSMAKPLIQNANTMLDMGTGGGEFLSMLRPFPPNTFATEGYKPNISIAKKRLEPLGVKVVPIELDSCLPFADNQFDLILNQHESYSAKEMKRIMKEKGIFFTQQVGGLDCLEINRMLEVPENDEYKNWNLKTAMDEIEEHGFTVIFSKEEFPIQRFYDIGALVYYLKAIPWQVQGFTIENHEENLYKIYNMIQSTGFFEVKQHRFVIKAIAK